ncbi:hypothetical protein [Rhodopirellula halodulae]|uniref:hypothetical protein n=1 Tax=Rhodopirellula halodulae TaxID=2894198 RepID=UPI001E2EFAA2|nr:hypothetical protein [Rhodopirellula sp. JC737]MCC9656615.1 hypothetical protein [Rhodopirellula sp. JC737]
MRRNRKTRSRKHTKSHRSFDDSLRFFAACLFVVAGTVVIKSDVSNAQQALPFRPIGSPSAVDQMESTRRENASQRGATTPAGYQNSQPQPNLQPTSHRGPARFASAQNYDPNVRQVAMQSGGFSLPGDFGASPDAGVSGGSPQTFSPPPSSQPVPSSNPFSAPPSSTVPQTGSPMTSSPPSSIAPPPVISTPPSSTPSNTPGINQGNSLRNDSFADGRSLPAPSSVPNDVIGGNPTFAPNRIGPAPSDYAPVPPPQLSNGGFATMSNCALITAPSDYSAMSPYSGYGYGQGCNGTHGVAPVGYVPPPAQIASPAAIPASQVPVAGTTVTGVPITTVPTTGTPAWNGAVTVPPVNSTTMTAGPAGALVDFGQGTNPVQVGPGLWGQPVAYVPGQSFRNWLRYFSF